MRDHFAEVEGARLHWAEVGEPTDTPPVILIHGLNNSYLSWSRVAPLLGTDRLVLMPDLPGHGESGRPDASYELDWYAHIIARWIEALGLPELDVVGHSFGGGVAQMLLLECPERIRRLVLAASGGLGKNVGWSLRLASIPWVIEHLGQPFMAIGTRLVMRGASEALTRRDIADLTRFNSQAGTARAFARTVRDVIDWRGQTRHFLQRVSEVSELPPVLVLWGDRDTIIPIEQARALTVLVQGAVFETFEGCGHYLHNERPEAFARAVRDFLDDPTVPAVHLMTATAAG